jgi:hypothetical protein
MLSNSKKNDRIDKKSNIFPRLRIKFILRGATINLNSNSVENQILNNFSNISISSLYRVLIVQPDLEFEQGKVKVTVQNIITYKVVKIKVEIDNIRPKTEEYGCSSSNHII